MRQSQLFPKTQKEAPKDETALNARLLARAGFVDKLIAGVYTFLPLGFRVLKKIEKIIREEMIKTGGQEILMPVLQPKENWQKTGRWDSLDTLFRFVSHYSKNEYALGPTHEEIVSPLVKKFSLSYKNLPLYLFQIQTKFRDEKRAKSGLLRGREFLMKDLYSFHTDEKDLDEYYEVMEKSYRNIFKRTGLGDKTCLTFASGGSFSKYSHEFQTLSEVGEDIIFLCEKCGVAVNAEIKEEQKTCPQCGNKDLIEKKAIEVGNIFKLKTKYSNPFELKFTAQDGQEKDVIMGCYGIGLSRLMAAIAEAHNDENGLIWPESVAPFKVHLISLAAGKTAGGKTLGVLSSTPSVKEPAVKEAAEKLYKELLEKNIEVLYDDREDISPGEKLVASDLIGLPWRAVISEKTISQNKIELKKRSEKQAKLISQTEFLKLIS